MDDSRVASCLVTGVDTTWSAFLYLAITSYNSYPNYEKVKKVKKLQKKLKKYEKV